MSLNWTTGSITFAVLLVALLVVISNSIDVAAADSAEPIITSNATPINQSSDGGLD